MRRVRGNAIALALAAAAAAGCRASEPPPVVLDLARAAPAAEFRGRWDLLLAGTPASLLRLKGASPAAGPGDPHVVLRRRPFVLLPWKGLTPRLAIIDLEPAAPGAPVPALVKLNESEIGRLVPASGRRRYLLKLPVEAQRRRQNVLRLEFLPGDGADAAASSAEPPAMARLYAIAVGAASDPALHDLASPAAPPPFSLAQQGATPALIQAAPGAIRYAIRVPEAGEIRFTPGLHAGARAAGARVDLRVTLEEKDGLESEVWSASLESGAAPPGEVKLPIPVRAGAVIRLALHAGGERFPWVVWSAPRVLGRGPSDPLAPRPAVAAEPARAAALRQALAGSSVLLVILDAAGAGHLGCYGYPRATTPELDRLAAEGVLFERAYTTAAYTRSAMASLWTSRYHDQHHAGLRYDAALPEGSPTLARLLSTRGIRTAGFVGNPSAGRPFGLEQGFAEFEAVYGRSAAGPSSRADVLRGAAQAWLAQRASGGRFFAYLHFREPHSPFDPPPPFDTRFGPDAPLSREERSGGWTRLVDEGRRALAPGELDHLVRLYDGNLAWVDSQLGELRRALEAQGVWESLVVIVTADHGEAFFEHGFIGHNKQLYQETLRIPLIVRLPAGKGPAGARVGELVDLVDLAPTIAEVFGAADPGFQGRSLLAVMAGAPGKPATLARSAHLEGLYSVTDARFKLIHAIGSGRDELYDLDADPGEKRNLAREQPVRADYYRQALHRWLMAVGPGRAAGAPRALTAEEQESLRALGYTN
jgi:arylsulfatase A-like enzyme